MVSSPIRSCRSRFLISSDFSPRRQFALPLGARRGFALPELYSHRWGHRTLHVAFVFLVCCKSHLVLHRQVSRDGTAIRGSSCGGTSAAPRRLDRGDVDLLHAHHRIERALCFIAAGRHRLRQHARRDLPGDAPLVFAPAALRSPGRHCRRWRSSSGRSLADRRWRSGTRRLRCA